MLIIHQIMIRNKLICFVALVIFATLTTKHANSWPQSKPVPPQPQSEANDDTPLQQPPPQDGGYDYDNSTNTNSTAEYEYYDTNNGTKNGTNNNGTDDYYQYYYDYDNSTVADNSTTTEPSDMVLQQMQSPFIGDNLNPNPLTVVKQPEKFVPQTSRPIAKPDQYIPLTKPPVIPSQQFIPPPNPPIINQLIIPRDDKMATPQSSRSNSDQNRQKQSSARQKPNGSREEPQKIQPFVPRNEILRPLPAVPQPKSSILNIQTIKTSHSPIRQTQPNIKEFQTVVTPSGLTEETDSPPGSGKKRDVRKAPSLVVTKRKPIEQLKPTAPPEQSKTDDIGKKVKQVNVPAQQTSTDPLNVECLAAHNMLRKKHRVPPFQIDTKLIQVAEQRAKALRVTDKLAHDFDISYGENLHSRKNAKTIACDIVVKSWYAEIKDYNFDDPKLVPENLHFTQIMWKSTTHIGCAQGYSEKSRKIYTVCNYNPEGNVVGEELQQILRPS